jgi:hypothetical protein
MSANVLTLPAETGHHAHIQHERYYNEFIAENTTAILEKIDGPDGFFAQAEKAGTLDRLNPVMERVVDAGMSPDAERRLGITKTEVKTIISCFKDGQRRSLLKELIMPRTVQIDRTQNTMQFEDGRMAKLGLRRDTGEWVVPNGRFNKRDGHLIMVPERYEEQFPDPAQRRIAALWGVAHEYTHSIIGLDALNAVYGRKGHPIVINGRTMDSAAYIKHINTTAFPASSPLTEYSASYRVDGGKITSPGQNNIRRIHKGVEEEMCETVAASIFGYAPTPNRDPQAALADPLAGRSAFAREVRHFVRAAPA